MKNIALTVLVAFILSSLISCGQDNSTVVAMNDDVVNEEIESIKTEPHNYGGWYCPDNLNGFPAVDIGDWKNVPVVNGRMATKEETQNGTSLIFVDAEKYPNAKPLDMTMPKLARFYCENTKREELIIVIQAINVDNDSVVGFRYLNGGNGSAWLKEVEFLTDNEIRMIPPSRFVSQTVQIKAGQDKIWKVLTNPDKVDLFNPIFDKDHKLKADWRKSSNVNYHYQNAGALTAAYAYKLFGNFYIQNDYDNMRYTEKFLLLENELTGITELKIVCGPFEDDFETQKRILINWGQKVKELSEK